MGLSYATLLTRISQFLQDTGLTTYDATELGMAIENELKRLSRYSPNIVEMIYQVESRTGTDVTGDTDKLTDLVKLQFLTTDDDNEKVVHNITDDTWAVATGTPTTSVLPLTKSIMAADEGYEIYNKRCKNKRQIYIGDASMYLWVDSVEYPIGTERNFIQISKDVIELDVEDSVIQDSDSTLSSLNKVNVLIRFALPLVLSQLTDWAGTLSAGAAISATTIAITGMGTTETIEVGEEFNLESHYTTYIVTTAVDMVATAGNVIFFPPLEAASTSGDDITFRKSVLQPNCEDLLERMVISRAIQSDMLRYAKSGAPLVKNYQSIITGNPLLNPVLIQRELESLSTPRTAKVLPR